MNDIAERIERLDDTVKAIANGASDEEVRKRMEYLDMLIEREATKAKFRKAVIEKTMVGLLIVALGWAATHMGRAVVEYVTKQVQSIRKE